MAIALYHEAILSLLRKLSIVRNLFIRRWIQFRLGFQRGLLVSKAGSIVEDKVGYSVLDVLNNIKAIFAAEFSSLANASLNASAAEGVPALENHCLGLDRIKVLPTCPAIVHYNAYLLWVFRQRVFLGKYLVLVDPSQNQVDWGALDQSLGLVELFVEWTGQLKKVVCFAILELAERIVFLICRFVAHCLEYTIFIGLWNLIVFLISLVGFLRLFLLNLIFYLIYLFKNIGLFIF